ncbi:MAG: hypothetical protein ACRDTT_04190 [Pseudonocardiaceae bacterium]
MPGVRLEWDGKTAQVPRLRLPLQSLPTSRRRTREEILALMDDISDQMEGVTGIDEELSRFRDDPHG